MLWPCSRRSSAGLPTGLFLASQVARFDGLYLAKTAKVAVFVRKGRGAPGSDDLESQLGPDHPRSQTQHVHVVVLHALPGGEGVVTGRRADARHLVRHDTRADAAAADEQASIRFS